MSDPFYALMLTKLLGNRYQVIDAAAQINFIAMAKGTVTADFTLDDAILNRIREKTSSGQKHHETFTVEIVDEEGRIVTSVEKTIYMRLKRHARDELEKGPGTDDDRNVPRRSRL